MTRARGQVMRGPEKRDTQARSNLEERRKSSASLQWCIQPMFGARNLPEAAARGTLAAGERERAFGDVCARARASDEHLSAAGESV